MSKPKAICDRVYAVGGPGLSAPEDAYVYLVDADSELVMIDAGVGYATGRIEDNIRSLGFEPARIWHIIATHCHIDHIGGLSLWKERYGCKVIAHELDRAGIEGENNDLTAASMYGVDYKPVKVDTILKGEREEMRHWRSGVQLPAHARPHAREHFRLYRYQGRPGSLRPGHSRPVLTRLGLRPGAMESIHAKAA